jgi:hypothetical protein
VRTASVRDAHADGYTANYAHAHTHTVTYADTHTDINSHSSSNCNAERVRDAYSVTHGYAQSDTQAAPDPAYPPHTALKEIVIGDR